MKNVRVIKYYPSYHILVMLTLLQLKRSVLEAGVFPICNFLKRVQSFETSQYYSLLSYYIPGSYKFSSPISALSFSNVS